MFNQGVRNLNDGLSLLNIADKAIENLSGIMIRSEELAEQSANGVYTNKQRKALDGEAQALSEEFFRISKTTEFNGQKLFIGENPVISLQAGIGSDAILNASVGGAIGTGELESAMLITTTAGVVAGDFDGDGTTDLVTYAGLGINVMIGDGFGGFGAATNYSLPNEGGQTDTETGDFNGDGVLDLAVAHYDGVVSVLIGDGSGRFASSIEYSTGDSNFDITVGDFNGDGVDDLAATRYGGANSIGILLGDGSGGFGALNSYVTGGDPGGVESSDMNGDGVLDLVTADYTTSTVSVLLGDGSGGFGAPSSSAAGDIIRGGDIILDDINGDGALDVMLSGLNDVAVFLGDGTGSLGPESTYAFGAPFLRGISSGDYNGDGFSDLAVAESGANVNILLGDGGGGFGPASTYATGANNTTMLSYDFNGDGVLDILTGHAGGSNLLLGSTSDGVAPLLDFSLGTISGARQALPVFGRKREQLAAQRGQIGANQAKIEVAANVLTVASENFKAAESRIRDADIAGEAANLTRLNILQQAASSILAQANQQPALALQLLG